MISRLTRLGRDLDLIHVVTTSRARLARDVPTLLRAMYPDGMLRVSWPEESSGVASTVPEDVVREVALPLGLELVPRRKLRSGR